MYIAATAFVRMWIHSHGPPKPVSGDREFVNPPFKAMLTMHGTELEERPARRHNKIGIVESRNNAIRLFFQTILKDSDYYRVNFGLVSSMTQVLSKVTFFTNALRGSAHFNSFELARG